MAFISDLDNRDFNGSQLSSFRQCLEDGLIVVTTRFLASGSGIDDDRRFATQSSELRTMLCAERSDWRIFADGELLLFVPEKLIGVGVTLHSLGFDASRLEPVSVEESLSGPNSEQKPTVDDYCDLLLEGCVQRYILVTGHGGASTSIAGMKSENYAHFLDRLTKLEVGGLVVRSCYAGGHNRLHYLDNSGETGLAHRPRLPFPVAVKSTGEVATRFDKGWKPSLLLKDMITFSKTRRRTKSEMEKILALRSARRGWRLENCVQITSGFHPGDAPGGFQFLSLYANEIILSHNGYVRQALDIEPLNKKIGQRPRWKISKSRLLWTDTQTAALKVQCLDVRTPLALCRPFPVFISSIPGTAHHFFEYISINGTLEALSSKMATVYRRSKTRKVVLVKRLEVGRGSDPRYLRGVVLNLGDGSVTTLSIEASRAGNRFYYKTQGQGYEEISRERYLLEVFVALYRSRPEDTASRLAGPWGESPDLWKDKFAELCQACCLNDNDPGLQAILQLPELMMLHARGRMMDAECQALEKALVEHTADGFGLLQAAVRLGLESLALRLLEESSKDELQVEQRDASSGTVLLTAVKSNWTDVVQKLLNRGARTDVANSEGLTPLMLAAGNNNTKLMSAMIMFSDCKVDVKDSAGRTALMHAHAVKGKEAFELLLAAGADPRLYDKRGCNLAAQAVLSGNLEALTTLVKEVDPALLNGGRISPLNMAIRLCRGDFVDALIDDLGVDVNHEDGKKNLPLVVALNHGSKRQLDQLLAAKAIDVNVGTKTTPLLAAVKLGSPAVVARLLDIGADPNREVGGESPLTVAAKRGDSAMVDLLTSHGAVTSD